MTTCSRMSVQVRLSEEGDFSITGKCIDALGGHPKDGHTRFLSVWQALFPREIPAEEHPPLKSLPPSAFRARRVLPRRVMPTAELPSPPGRRRRQPGTRSAVSSHLRWKPHASLPRVTAAGGDMKSSPPPFRESGHGGGKTEKSNREEPSPPSPASAQGRHRPGPGPRRPHRLPRRQAPPPVCLYRR